jgi:hypothetical protein
VTETTKHAIYHPPRDGLPYLVVTILSEREVVVTRASTRKEALSLVTMMSRPKKPTAPR